MLSTSNATKASMGWSREEIMAGIAKMKAIEKLPSNVRMSQATTYEFLRRYTTPLQAAGIIDKMFGLQIILDETLPFGEYKFK